MPIIEFPVLIKRNAEGVITKMLVPDLLLNASQLVDEVESDNLRNVDVFRPLLRYNSSAINRSALFGSARVSLIKESSNIQEQQRSRWSCAIL